MTYSKDFRWRVVALVYIYGVPTNVISELLGPKPRSIQRWYSLFSRKGDVEVVTVEEREKKKTRQKWPQEVQDAVLSYTQMHPTFYLDELQDFLKSTFPDLKNVSTSTICICVSVDLQLTRKMLTKALLVL